jgi:hypothetical protein
VSSHTVQFFDDIGSLADGVFAVVRDGLLAGDPVLLLLTPPHWQVVSAKCRSNGVDVDAAIAAGWLTVRDAADLLDTVMRRDKPDWTLFEGSIGTLIRELSANGGRLRVYGEMVNLLARANDFRGAHRIEEFWHRLAEQESVTVFCGYSAEHFGNPRDADSLREICRLHSHVQTDPRDVLGSFLIRTHVACEHPR